MVESIVELHSYFKSERLKPSEFLKKCFNKIENDDESQVIFTSLFKEKALNEAVKSDSRYSNGSYLSKIDGIPIALKDNIRIKDTYTSFGLKHEEPIKDEVSANIYLRCIERGAIVVGKTTMNEIAFSGLGLNFSLGTPTNAQVDNKKYLPGGSSSGSALSVAKGFTPVAIGTDTGGSVRIPASWNSIYGLKTTENLISTYGIVPLSNSLDTVGFLTNSVNDAEIIFEEITGKKVYELSPISLDGLVIYSCENGLTEDMDSSILSTYNHVISLIEEAGIVVKKRRFKEVDEILELSSRETNLITYEAYKNWNKFINDNPGLVPDYIVKRVMKGADISDEAISIYKEKVLKLKNRIIKELSDSVGFLMPTVAINPPVLEEVKTDEGLFFKNNRLALRNTRVANLLGLCSMTIPIKSYSKFPIGVMLNCEPFAETTLLRMARLIENATSGVDS